MDVNVFFQLCGFIDIIIIFFSFLFKKKMLTKNNLIFLEMIIISLFALVVDFSQAILLTNSDIDIPSYVIKDVCKLKMGLYVFINYELVRYISAYVFKVKPIIRTTFNALVTIFLFAAIGFILFSPIKILNYGEYNSYASGLAAYAMHGAIIVFILISYTFTLIKENVATKKRKRVIRLWVYIWSVASVIEIMWNLLFKDKNKYPLLGFAAALCMLIMFIIVENPDYYLDKETKTFNQSKCMEYTSDLHRKNKEYYVLLVMTDTTIPQFRNYNFKLDTICDYAKDITLLHKGKVFRSDNDNFMIISRKSENLDIIIDTLNNKYNIVDVESRDIKFFHILKFIKLLNPYVAENNVDVIEIIKDVSVDFSSNKSAESVLVLDDSVIEKINKEKKMEVIVNNAIRNDNILVYFQPIYSLKEKRFVSAEALTRLKDDEGNIIYPGSFIEVCEKNGSIFKLGTLVFEHVCRFINRYNMDLLGIHYIEVNLSALQCEYDGIADLYISILEKYNVDPKYINLEITETGNANRERMIANMQKLVDYGVSFSLDDFGTGNSNLNYIVDMPVALVKFDKEMVTAFFEDKKAKFVMSSAITMIKDMNLKIVLEGIEEKGQISSIQRRKIDVDYIQGYVYSKPIPEDMYVDFLKEKHKIKEDVMQK